MKIKNLRRITFLLLLSLLSSLNIVADDDTFSIKIDARYISVTTEYTYSWDEPLYTDILSVEESIGNSSAISFNAEAELYFLRNVGIFFGICYVPSLTPEGTIQANIPSPIPGFNSRELSWDAEREFTIFSLTAGLKFRFYLSDSIKFSFGGGVTRNSIEYELLQSFEWTDSFNLQSVDLKTYEYELRDAQTWGGKFMAEFVIETLNNLNLVCGFEYNILGSIDDPDYGITDYSLEYYGFVLGFSYTIF